MLRRVKRLTKITPKATGPYVVLKVRGQFGQKVTIELRDQPNKGNKRKRQSRANIVHASQLAPYYETKDAEDQLYEGDEDEPDG